MELISIYVANTYPCKKPGSVSKKEEETIAYGFDF